MKPKPQPKTEIAIYTIDSKLRNIFLDSTPDAAAEFAEFGVMSKDNIFKNRYLLTVDARYDFDEVVNWIRNYGKHD